MTLELKTAEELIDSALEKRWSVRRGERRADVLREILSAFVARGGPVSVNAIIAAFPDRPAQIVREIVTALDDEDLIQVTDEQVVIAYPFSASPTAFVVGLAAGGERYACCAIDASGSRRCWNSQSMSGRSATITGCRSIFQSVRWDLPRTRTASWFGSRSGPRASRGSPPGSERCSTSSGRKSI